MTHIFSTLLLFSIFVAPLSFSPLTRADEPSSLEVYNTVCASCHGEKGVTSLAGTPHLAGQYKDYLVYAMKSYKSGIRNNAVMSSFMASLSDKQIREIAAYLSSLEGPLATSPK